MTFWGKVVFFFSFLIFVCLFDFPGGSDSKASACSAGDLGLIPELGRSPGEGNGNPLQYSCLENPMGRGAWQYSPWGHKQLDTTEPLHFPFLSKSDADDCSVSLNFSL